MTVQKGDPNLPRERVHTDQAVRSRWGQDAQANLNRLREQNLHTPAPGASSISHPGHIHRNNGDGRGILRLVDGGFYIVGGGNGYLQSSVIMGSTESMGVDNSSDYQVSQAHPFNYIMGVAYVSPGIAAIKVELQAWDNTGLYAQIRACNLESTKQNSPWQAITATPGWYSLIVPVTPTNGRVMRCELDVEIRAVGGGPCVVRLTSAWPFEYTDAP
jgi:hypothetical protein